MKSKSVGLKILLSLLTLLFIALGAWVLLMLIKGDIPVDNKGNNPNPIVVGVFGGAFCVSGLLGFVFVWVSDCARGLAIKAGLMTAIAVISGLIFLSVAIVAPDEIVTTRSFMGVETSRSQGGWIAATTFALVGVLPIIFVRKIYRFFKKSIENT